MADYQHLEDGNNDGTLLGGATTDKIGFYGTTPAAKTAVSATAVTAIGTTTISQVATSGKWAFASSTAAAALVTRVDQLQVDVEALITQLNTLGLV